MTELRNQIQLDHKAYYNKNNITLYLGDCLKLMSSIADNSIDMIFADPPYLLSNNGFTCKNGQMVSVNKGKWDQSQGFISDVNFHELWITESKRILKHSGTIWISGTYHSIYQCGFILQKKGFIILNDIAWFKPNAPPNLSCRFFTASHETLLWAKKNKQTKHFFNYESMKNTDFPKDYIKNKNKQMRSVWVITSPSKQEKQFGKHPTQKPIELLTRVILSSTDNGSTIIDPFCGSGTCALVTAMLGNRNFIGFDIDKKFLDIATLRLDNYFKNKS